MQSQGIPNIRRVSRETSGERKTMLNRKVKPIAALIGTAFVASLATANVANAGELFTTTALDTGYDLLAQADAEGKCGEGKWRRDKRRCLPAFAVISGTIKCHLSLFTSTLRQTATKINDGANDQDFNQADGQKDKYR